MTGLEIALLLVGVAFLVGSFFASEKLSSSDLETLKKLSEAEIKTIISKNLAESESKIEEAIQEKLELSINDLEIKTDKETNEKIMEISEYSNTVLDSMNKSHNEIVFIYDMLNDKQEKVTALTKELQRFESEIVQMGSALEDEKESLNELLQKQIEIKDDEFSDDLQKAESKTAQQTIEEALKENQTEEISGGNKEILSLYEQGMNEIEIAKKLGRGLGEVKLVLGLFSGGKEE